MKTLNILGYTYKLDLSKPLSLMKGNVGYCDFNNKILRVAKDVDDEVANSTLLHEIIEAVNYHLEIELEERQVKQIEVGLHQTLKDAGIDLGLLRK